MFAVLLGNFFKKKSTSHEEGFSFVEIVAVIAILIALTTGGLFIYSGVQDNARQAVVDGAASNAFTMATAYYLDNNKETEPNDAEFGWNKSSPSNEESTNAVIVKVWDLRCEGHDKDSHFYGVKDDGSILFAVRASNQQGHGSYKYYYSVPGDSTDYKYDCKYAN